MGDDRTGFTENGDSSSIIGAPEYSDQVDDSLDYSISKQDPRQIARPYQLELSKRALDENVIVVLETGCGKTLISILLMCDMGHLIKKPRKSVCVFLAPTVLLVHQQARVIEQCTDFKVGIYCGDAKHLKSHHAWEKEIDQYEVLVMIPQVLLRSLCHCFIRMEMITLLIFDECHHAQIESNHPYAEIMKVFYDTELPKVPRIFGMTASPICGKGASINSLEALLHSKVYTVNNKNELDAVVVSPLFQVYYYNSSTMLSSSSYLMCLSRLEDIKRKCVSVLCRAVDDASRVQNIKKLLQKLHKNMVFSLTHLGLWGALQACRILLNDDGYERNELIKVKENTKDDFLQNEYLAQIASLLGLECMRGCSTPLQKHMREEMFQATRAKDFWDKIGSDLSAEQVLKEPYFSQKVLRLIRILSNFRLRPDMKCIIFVNRIVVARSLSYILGQIKILSAWKCDFLVGLHSGLKWMSRRTMSDILGEFRSGKLNLLVATKVGEEGLDIQTCCLVIRFDLPETLASFIQSRGRARMPKSEYAFLVDSDSERDMNLVSSFRKDEDRMNLDIQLRKPGNIVANTKEEVYSVGSTGAKINAQASVSLLYHYCSKLPHDEFFNPKPNLFYVDDAEGTICHIILPCNAPIHHITSSPQSSILAAKRDACLKACKELHRIGALTEYLLPEQDDINEVSITDVPDPDGSEDEDSPFELQEMLIPAALKEPWSDMSNVVCLNAYFIRFRPVPADRQYKDFGLFITASLPCEAERMKIDLHLAHGRSVLTDLSSSGRVEFNGEELLLAQNFQEMFFKIILDRSEFMDSHVLLKNQRVTDSKSSTCYLLLPVIWQEPENRISVDWMVIRRCLSSPIFLPPTHIVESPIPLRDYLQLADGPVDVNTILNSLVYVAHRRSFFFVSQVLREKNGYSLHSGDSSHVEHLSKKFNIHLGHPEQPLLKAKLLFSLHNWLHDRRVQHGNSEAHDLEEHFLELPPELCELKIIGFSKDIGSSLSLLPSVMHRLESLLVAIELKDMLSKSFTEGALVTAERILEALTTERCCERFSLERLEVLGDAFLKFAVGRHVFLKYEAFDEGQLTKKRSNAVDNSNLCKLAINHKLLAYIRDQEFDPSQVFTLGRPCPIICTKQTEKSIHSDCEANLIKGTSTHQVRCSKNHRWLSKKTIADMVEALIGAYVVDSGFQAAIAFLRWLGIEAEFDVSQVCYAWSTSVRFMSVAHRIDIPSVEGCLNHMFVHKGILLQALIHPSYNRHGGGCYQRLEFLGDAALDYLITSYLYSAFPDLKPGQLTDLRSSLVNNISFAKVAVIRSLHRFIIFESGPLSDAINKYVNFIGKPASERDLLEEPTCPKVLGDLVESCFGAILLDGGFDLNYVWAVMLSFLEPVMSFLTLQLNPKRELHELSQKSGWNLQFLDSKKNRSVKVDAIVDGRNFHEAASAISCSKKGASHVAAKRLIEKLKTRGHWLRSKSLQALIKSVPKMEARLVGYDETPLSPASSSSSTNVENLGFADQSNTYVNSDFNFANLSLEDHSNASVELDFNFVNLSLEDHQDQEHYVSRQPTDRASLDKKSPRSASSFLKRRQHSQPIEDESRKAVSDTQDASRKSAQSQLNEICVANCWRSPSYECCKEEGPSHLRMFTFKVTVIIEDAEDMTFECFSRPQSKKKVAKEEAATGALWFLKEQGYTH